MRLKISFEIQLTREPPPDTEPQPEGAYATVETAPPHYPLGFSPNNVEAKDDEPPF